MSRVRNNMLTLAMIGCRATQTRASDFRVTDCTRGINLQHIFLPLTLTSLVVRLVHALPCGISLRGGTDN